MKFRHVCAFNFYDKALRRRVEKLIAVTTKGNLVERFDSDPPGVFHRIPTTPRRKPKP